MALIPADEEELDALEARIDAWLARTRGEIPVVAAVERGEPGERRWYVRLAGEQKGPFTVWLTLRQRTLHHETYMTPAPVENQDRFYEQLLRRNRQMRGMAFAIGDEDALYIVGQVPVDRVDDAHLDWVLGAVWTYVEQYFRPAMRIGFASLFRG